MDRRRPVVELLHLAIFCRYERAPSGKGNLDMQIRLDKSATGCAAATKPIV